jgi:isopropylmalate/homocitrate/citramalate synthase
MDNEAGVIRQTEFFLYSKTDRNAALKCLERGYKFPEVTAWIRACKEDFQLVKDMGIKETGILVSCSDYHIFKKLKLKRSEAMHKYLEVVNAALENGIIPRCHFEDITRADFYGFVVPFASELMKLSKESGIQVKIRACDTMGLGVGIPGVALPRSVPGIIYGLKHYADVPSESLEWHGHNDFYKAVNNSTTAWLYGSSAINTSLFGINNQGQMVGEYDNGDQVHGFILTGGSFVTEDDPRGLLSTVIFGINSTDQIVSLFVTAAGVEHGCSANCGTRAK